jgi:tRNA (guanine-N7-)-methyltransferase
MSEANSAFIVSAQHGPHDDLPAVVRRHLDHPFRKPFADYNRAAFAAALQAWRDYEAHVGQALPLVLDAGCGVGWSTIHLARIYADCFVIGVDQSRDRLERGKDALGSLPENALLIRADLVDFWRLLAEAGIRLQHHYLLYPNPWPKIGHLGRRWPGHPVFPALLQLGGTLECRSNWRIYVEEMAIALELAGAGAVAVEAWRPEICQTPFEKKYLASGHALWRCRVDLR